MYRSLQQSKPGLLCYFLGQDNLTVLLFNQWHKYGCYWQTVCRPNKVVRDSLGQTGKCISAKEVGYSYLPTRTGSYHFVQDHILCLLTLPSVLSSPLGGGGTLQSLGGGVPLDTKTLTLYQNMINQTLQLHLDQPPKPRYPGQAILFAKLYHYHNPTYANQTSISLLTCSNIEDFRFYTFAQHLPVRAKGYVLLQ